MAELTRAQARYVALTVAPRFGISVSEEERREAFDAVVREALWPRSRSWKPILSVRCV